jgi:hypothetical protein
LHSYQPQSSARLINCYTEAAPPEAKAPVEVTRAPGIVTASSPALGPGRGLYVFKDTLYAVCGTSLITVNAGGAATTVGIVPGVERVTWAENASQLAICSDNKVHVFTAPGAITTAAVNISTIAALDGYVIGTRTGTTGQFASSALQNALSWPDLNFATAESSPDPLVGLIVDHREILLGGTQTIEAWYNAGSSAFPFERSPSTGVIELGLAAGQSFAKQDNSAFWLASDLTVRRLQGATPLRVSQHGVETAIRSYATVTNAYGFAYSWNGHLCYALTFPGIATWVYDATTDTWHERKSEGAADWRVTGAAEAYQRVYVQRISDGAIGYLTNATVAEFEGAFRTDDVQFGNVYDEAHRLVFDRLEVRYRATKAQTGALASPSVTLYLSDDGGTNFRVAGSRAEASLGLIGERPRVFWTRLGSSRERSFRLRFADPNPVTIEDATVYATPCRS